MPSLWPEPTIAETGTASYTIGIRRRGLEGSTEAPYSPRCGQWCSYSPRSGPKSISMAARSMTRSRSMARPVKSSSTPGPGRSGR